MTMQQLLWQGTEKLNRSSVPDAGLDARYLLLEAFGESLASFLAIKDKTLPEDEETFLKCRKYEEMIDRRAERIPLQHLTGVQEFMGFEFYVNEHVLIPRQDTETLVELVLQEQKGKDAALLDVCTGSGCIAISLALMGGFRDVTALDVSREALMVAARNAQRLLKEHEGDFNLIESDMFERLEPDRRYDIIVSNPPYIPSHDIEGLEPEVRDYEPRMALDGRADGLAFYRILAQGCRKHLAPGGCVYMEIGFDQGLPVRQMFEAHGYVQVGRRQERIMFDRLDDMLIHYEELMLMLGDPAVTQDTKRFTRLMKEQADLAPIVEAYKQYKQAKQDVEDSLALLEEENDEEMREMAKEELSDAKKRIEELEHELKILLLPKDPNDDKNIILEIRAGAGGDEAALFAAELYRMYSNYADSHRWKVEIISLNENGIGGFKEVVAMVTGKGAYSKLKYESGVHRVQRVPETESGGRIHTSTATVAVMPEAEEVDVQIDMNDIRIDVMRASGNGGQCVNTTDSAVRLTHMPTGIVIYSQTEKSQLQNKEKAFRLLRSKLYDIELEKRQSSEAEERRSQIGTGDRSEKIRTYNFPQGRVTDHRIKLTLYKIDSIMNGDIQELLDNLIAADQAAKLAKMNEAI